MVDKTYSHALRKRILYGCAIFTIILCFIMGGIGAVNYSRGMLKRYMAYMEGILQYAMTEIDADDLEKCISSGEVSDSFNNTQDVFDRIKENYQVEFIYIVKPLNTSDYDNMMNIMAGVTEYEKEYESDTIATLGELTGDAYSSKIAGFFMDKMNENGETITFFTNMTGYGYDYTGFVPISNSKGEHIAVLAVDISIQEIRSVLVRYIIIILITMVILACVFMAGIYRWLRERVITPISKIQTSAENFVKSSHGQKDPDKIIYDNPNINSDDEIQALSESLVTMASDLKAYMKNLMKETKEKERIGAELNVATQIQADMLPRIFPAFPNRKEFDIYATMTPAKEVGGDFYDFFFADENHLALVMADVSGKGVPAALFMVIAKTLIKNRVQMADTFSPGKILADVNEQLCEGNEAGLFVTVWLGIIDISTGKGIEANAGHEHPAIRRANGQYELSVYKHSPAVATIEGIRFKEHEFELNAGDSLFVYTDGVAEATDSNNVLYGTERMLEALNKETDAKPQKLLENVKDGIDGFVKKAPQFDDITMLAFTYFGSHE